jgi:hypothetical protein
MVIKKKQKFLQTCQYPAVAVSEDVPLTSATPSPVSSGMLK